MAADTKKSEKTPGSPSNDSSERMRPKALDWLFNDNQQRTRKSRKQEDRVAGRLGGRRLRRSGGSQWSRDDKTTDDGDIGTPEFHIEQKSTEKASMSIKRSWLDKVREGARKFGKDPAVVISFVEPNKPAAQPEDWICIPVEVAQRILGYDDDED
jgi:hypothetical protein